MLQVKSHSSRNILLQHVIGSKSFRWAFRNEMTAKCEPEAVGMRPFCYYFAGKQKPIWMYDVRVVVTLSKSMVRNGVYFPRRLFIFFILVTHRHMLRLSVFDIFIVWCWKARSWFPFPIHVKP